jgi:hypothetical protein
MEFLDGAKLCRSGRLVVFGALEVISNLTLHKFALNR